MANRRPRVSGSAIRGPRGLRGRPRCTAATVLAATLLAAAPALAGQGARHALHARPGLTHRSIVPTPTADLIARWESPRRDGWQQPARVVAALDLRPGMVVADIGAGSGYFTIRLAAAVGRSGRVYAVDIDPDLLAYLSRRVHLRRLGQVVVHEGRSGSPDLPARSVHLAFICDTLHHIDRPADYLTRLREALAPAGRIAIVEFRKVHEPEGPPYEHRMSRDQIVAIAARAGLALVEEHDDLPRQTFLVFAPRP